MPCGAERMHYSLSVGGNRLERTYRLARSIAVRMES